MGNELGALDGLAKIDQMQQNLKDPLVRKEFEKDGVYTKYRIARIEAQLACTDPHVHSYPASKQLCVQKEVEAQMLQIDAYLKTRGVAAFMDSVISTK